MIDLLIVDDESLVRSSIQSLGDWESEGFRFLAEAGNGREALEALERHPSIRIVLLDIFMPVMDGLEFLEQLADRPISPVVIVLSAHDQFSSVRKAFQLGVSDYLLKSEIDRKTLLRELRKTAAILPPVKKIEVGEEGAGARLENEDRILQLLVEDLVYDRNRKLTTSLLVDRDFLGGNPFHPAAFRFEFSLDDAELAEQQQRSLLLQARSYLNKQAEGYTQLLSNGVLLFLLGENNEGEEDREEFCRDFQELIRISMNLHPLFFLGRQCESLESLPAEFSRLVQGLSGDSRISIRAKQYIARHYDRPGLSLDEVSTYVEVSRTHLSSQFKKDCGLAFWDYVTQYRVNAAKLLLTDTNMRNYEVAEAVGYLNVEHFSRVFKRVTGLSPRQYSRQAGIEN